MSRKRLSTSGGADVGKNLLQSVGTDERKGMPRHTTFLTGPESGLVTLTQDAMLQLLTIGAYAAKTHLADLLRQVRNG
jgi:hypothetical protein